MSARLTWFSLAALSYALSLAPFVSAQGLDEADEREAAKAAPADDTKAPPAAGAPAGGTESSESPAPAEAPPLPPPPSRMRVAPFAGFGFGTRAFVRPTQMSTGQRLPTIVFPAAEVGLGATL